MIWCGVVGWGGVVEPSNAGWWGGLLNPVVGGGVIERTQCWVGCGCQGKGPYQCQQDPNIQRPFTTVCVTQSLQKQSCCDNNHVQQVSPCPLASLYPASCVAPHTVGWLACLLPTCGRSLVAAAQAALTRGRTLCWEQHPFWVSELVGWLGGTE